MAKITHFKPEMFTATEHTPAQKKAEWANRLASFISNGFRYADFSNIVYTRLSMCFSHIAHYNRDGFYEVWFSSPEKQSNFIKHMLDYKPVGYPKFTFVDVEKELQKWLIEQKIQEKVEINATNEKLYVVLEGIVNQILLVSTAPRTPELIGLIIDQAIKIMAAVNNNVLDQDRVTSLFLKISNNKS